MRVGIATVQVPFVRGGAEMLAENLLREVRAAGHEAEVARIFARLDDGDVDVMTEILKRAEQG